MNHYTNQTISHCKKCNRELHGDEKEIAEKTNNPYCTECNYLSAIGVNTIQEYNAWIRKNAKKEG